MRRCQSLGRSSEREAGHTHPSLSARKLASIECKHNGLLTDLSRSELGGVRKTRKTECQDYGDPGLTYVQQINISTGFYCFIQLHLPSPFAKMSIQLLHCVILLLLKYANSYKIMKMLRLLT